MAWLENPKEDQFKSDDRYHRPQDKPQIKLTEKTESNFYLDELVDSILGGLDYFQLMELLWCRCSGSRFNNCS